MSLYFKRLISVVGSVGKTDEVIYCRKHSDDAAKTVVYFGGDLQDDEERMLSHCQFFSKWNLDATAKILANSFPNSDVFVVRPSKMYLNKFSCFSNFVECDEVGSPTYASDGRACDHLLGLVLNCYKMLDKEGLARWQLIGDCSLVVVGFSKGCVVLNQLLYEMHRNRNAAETVQFVKKLRALYWLDAGHNGEEPVWITDQNVLSFLAETGVEVHVHVTPYQMEDARRPWIKEEKEKFVDVLKKCGCNLTEKYHFSGEPPTIERHFQLLTNFMN